jgi:3-methyl-2-oxobutanoate hydroxymethyltransferase
MRKKVTILTLQEKMAAGEQITMITGYDYPMALMQEKAGMDIILVGDSLGMTVLGFDSTLPVGMDTMIDHAKAVRRGAPTAYVIGDMPYMSYQISIEQAIKNAGRFMQEAGCDAIKLEGGSNVVDIVEALTKATIPVMGHIGLTPQSIAMLGGFKSQGRSLEAAEKLIDDAKALEEAGIVTLLIEAVPPEVGRIITEQANVPVIGIGAGPHCHGQLLISHDMLGCFEAFTPKFVKKYTDLGNAMREAFEAYINEVKEGKFPAEEHYYKMHPGEAEELLKKYGITD